MRRAPCTGAGNFEQGDLVRLDGSKRLMVVNTVSTYGLECKWFMNGKVMQGLFAQEDVILVRESGFTGHPNSE